MSHSANVLILPGSLRRPSYTRGLCDSISHELRACGLTPEFFDPREMPLPLHDAVYHKAPARNPHRGVATLVGFAERADAFVLASPIYHNGPSGVLKNALDHLAIPHFAYKPVGLVSHGGQRTSQAVDQMRIWVRGLGGCATTVQICTQRSDHAEALDEQDPPVRAEEILMRIRRFCLDLQVMAQVLGVARRSLIR